MARVHATLAPTLGWMQRWQPNWRKKLWDLPDIVVQSALQLIWGIRWPLLHNKVLDTVALLRIDWYVVSMAGGCIPDLQRDRWYKFYLQREERVTVVIVGFCCWLPSLVSWCCHAGVMCWVLQGSQINPISHSCSRSRLLTATCDCWLCLMVKS